MMFTASNGKTHHEVHLEPTQEVVPCPCGGAAYKSPWVKLSGNGVYTYECPWCGEAGSIQGSWTREHWPEWVRKEASAPGKGPFVVKEEVGMCLFNTAALSELNLHS